MTYLAPFVTVQSGQAQRGAAIASQRPSRATSAPFITRRSTLVFSAICLLAGLAFQSLVGGDASGDGTIGLLASVTGAAALVCGIVAWIGGVVLALRAGSTLWLVVAVLPFVPINSMMTAMFCPTTPAGRRQ
jgi:hypothetical protein